jgi:exopolysaccharide biosynthesis protein
MSKVQRESRQAVEFEMAEHRAVIALQTEDGEVIAEFDGTEFSRAKAMYAAFNYILTNYGEHLPLKQAYDHVADAFAVSPGYVRDTVREERAKHHTNTIQTNRRT